MNPATRRISAVIAVAALAAAVVLTSGGGAIAADVTVEARDNFFLPKETSVRAGTTVTFRNTGSVAHTVTSSGDPSTEADDGATFDATIQPGESVTIDVTEAGKIPFFCRFHGFQTGEGMAGLLSVQSAPVAARLAGEGRFETAVEISKRAFPGGAGEVFLARADGFADALAGSSLTKLGPVLLVPSCGPVPQVVLDEVARLAPAKVTALGGTSAVCTQVLTDVRDAA